MRRLRWSLQMRRLLSFRRLRAVRAQGRKPEACAPWSNAEARAARSDAPACAARSDAAACASGPDAAAGTSRSDPKTCASRSDAAARACRSNAGACAARSDAAARASWPDAPARASRPDAAAGTSRSDPKTRASRPDAVARAIRAGPKRRLQLQQIGATWIARLRLSALVHDLVGLSSIALLAGSGITRFRAFNGRVGTRSRLARAGIGLVDGGVLARHGGFDLDSCVCASSFIAVIGRDVVERARVGEYPSSSRCGHVAGTAITQRLGSAACGARLGTAIAAVPGRCVAGARLGRPAGRPRLRRVPRSARVIAVAACLDILRTRRPGGARREPHARVARGQREQQRKDCGPQRGHETR